ncbi:hypothetical protein R0J87_20530, partial [Halomonas sp. SIMBA_159]
LTAGTSDDALNENSSLSVQLSLAAVAGMFAGILLGIMFELVGFARKHTQFGRKKTAQLQTVFK